MTHSEQITDTSSLNMFYNDELFTNMVLGTNFFRVASLETTFAAPPLCRHDPDTPTQTTTVGWKPGDAAAATAQSATSASMMLVAEPSSAPTTVPVVQSYGAPWQAVAPVMLLVMLFLAGLVYRAGVKQGQKEAVCLPDGVHPLLP